MEPSSSSSSKRKRDPDCFDELSCKRQKNDVFLNYSYEDIGKGFVSHLKGRLIGNGYNISDHTMLPIGGDESSELVKAIEESDIYLVVFSSKYASSIKCLDELVDIMDCHKKFKKRKVIPIFFNVNPSHARNQKGRSFTRAFKKHETTINPERVQKWRQALHKAGQLTGLPLQKGDEEKFLRKIVKMLRNMQNPQELCHLEFPVGIASRAQDLISVVSDQVFPIVAVLGISGSGKTTIAKAVYDRIAKDFEIKCYIGDIQNYQCRGGNWKFDLQKDAISCLTGNDKFPIGTHNDGAAKIKKIIKGRKALFVLDDVGEFEQLQALGIHPASLRCGSRIIVTTRNKESLSNLPYIPYELSLLNERESYELFTRLAFGKDEPIDGKFVYEIVRRAEGVPLVLEVWGRYFKSHARTQWPSLLEKLKKIPHEDIQKKLKMSYDSLTEKRVKKFFLDIACFFVGKEKDLVIQVLQDEDSAFYPDIEIQYLVDRGLVKTDYNINMNHVIREMGQEVVHRENEDEPGQRTRLVDHRDVVRVLRDCSGTESVESIRLKYAEKSKPIVQLEALKKMSNLRLINLSDLSLQWSSSSSSSSSSNDDTCSLSFKKLKYFEWVCFPFKCIDNIDMSNIVVIKLWYSKLEILWEGFKSLKKLRILDVSLSMSLTKTGNLRGLEELEKLCLFACEKLEELDTAIGCLKKLVLLDLHDCKSLVKLPFNMSELQSLTELILDGCCKLEPEGLKKVTGLRNLEILNMRNCNVSKVSSEIGNLVSLEFLDLSENAISSLPDSFSNLSKLLDFKINSCSQLKLLPLLPSNLLSIEACGYISLDVMPYDSVQTAYIFCSKWFEESFFTKDKELYFSVSAEEVPEWCSYRSTGDVLSFVAPMHLDKKICGVIVCTSFNTELHDFDHEADWKKCFSPTMLNKTKETSHGFDSPELCSLSSVIVMFCPLNDTTLVVEAGGTVLLEFKIKDYSSIDFMSCGLRLIYEGEVVDSELISQNIFEPPPVTLITVPTSKMTPAADDEAAASITELDDDDNSVCSSPFQYNEIIYYKILDETFMNECFETSFPSEMMIVDDCSWNSSVI